MITAPEVFLYIILQFLIYFPAGFIVLRNRMKAYPFLINLPIFICTGLFVEMIILSIVGIFYVGDLVLVSTSIIFYFVIFLIYKNYFSFTFLRLTIKQSLKKIRAVHIVTISLIVLTISGFSLLAGFMEWPRGHDSLTHGFLTSLLIENHKLQSTLAPIVPTQPWLEPVGVHILSSNLSMLVGIFPGESLLVFATTLLILFMLLVYSLVYVLTKSLGFSVLASTAVFYFYPALNLEYSFMGLYYLGAFAALFGNLGLILFLTFISIFKNSFQSIRSFLIIGLSLIGMGIAYPPFILIPTIFLLIMVAKLISRKTKAIFLFLSTSFGYNRHEITNVDKSNNANPRTFYQATLDSIKTNRKLMLAVVVISVIIIIIPVIILVLNMVSPSSNDNMITTLITRLDLFSSWYQFPFEMFEADIPTVGIVLITIVLAIDSLLRKKRIAMSVFYLLYASIELLSIREGSTFNVFWIFYPSRLFPFLVLFSWIALSVYINDRWIYFERFVQRKITSDSKARIKKVLLNFSKPIFAVAVISIFFLSAIIYNMSFENAKYWGNPNISFKNDYELLAWVSQNTDSSSLIMNDYSWNSQFLESFSAKNITSSYWPSTIDELGKARDSQIAWNRPEFMEDFIRKYNVSYILLVDDPLDFNPLVVGGDNQFYLKTINRITYKNIFNHMPFLKLMKDGPEPDSGAIYKVIGNDS